jgi:hypothetical protein
MTPGLVLMNSLTGVIGHERRILIPALTAFKMPQRGIDVTLTSCFTGAVIFLCYIFCMRDLGSGVRFPRVGESPTDNQAQPDIRNIQ